MYHVKRYVKKPVEIEAIQFTRSNWEEVKRFTNHTAHSFNRNNDTCIIPTL